MAHAVIRLGSIGPDVKKAQQELILRNYPVGPKLDDGIFGNNTLAAVIDYQTDRWAPTDADGKPLPYLPPPPAPPPPTGYLSLTWPLAIDGVVGRNTWARLDPRLVQKGDKGPTVKLLQALLANFGVSQWDPGPIDGDFEKLTEDALKNFQRDWSLTIDGKAGPETWRALRS